MKNKKGNLPITIFVIGVVAVCILTVLSFIISAKKISSEDWGFEALEKVKSDLEKFYFYRDVGFTIDESAEKINAIIQEEEIDGKSRDILKIEEKKGVVKVIYNKILND